MTKRARRKAHGRVRPVKAKRDYEGAAAVVKRLSGQADRDSAAERRLQSLLRELEKFDDQEDDAGADLPGDYDYSGPGRRIGGRHEERLAGVFRRPPIWGIPRGRSPLFQQPASAVRS